MDRDPLLRTLRAALAADLADHVGALEEGIVALEREPPGARRDALLRDVFRAAHGLKGAARAAGVPELEATCHAMESLLGAARDEGRRLDREDFAALLSGVDALADAQRSLGEAQDGPLAAAPFARALEALRARTGEDGSLPTPTPTPSPPMTPSPTPSPSSTPTPTTSTPSATPPQRRRGSLRLAPERLDALALAGGALVAAAHVAGVRAERAEELAREVHRIRTRRGRARPALALARAAPEGSGPSAAASSGDDLLRVERALSSLRAQLTLDARALARRTQRLADEIRALRLTAWGEATAGLERTARDVATALGKEVDVVVSGEGLELDRSVVDALRDPLSQLVRNAVDHGIERPDERAAGGKPAAGRIEVSAEIDGERLSVRVVDDGRGLDPQRLREEARRRGLEAPEDPRRALTLLFVPGFSTAQAVTEVSGRGVGLDVVASAVRAMRGTVAVSSTPGEGTAFDLQVPTTLYGMRALLAQDAGQVFAVPALDVERVLRVRPEQVRTSGGRPVLLGPGPLPIAPLGHALGLASGPWDPAHWRTALVLAAGRDRAAFAVEEVLAERELSLEPLPGPLHGLPLANAVAVLPGGALAVVLASRDLVEAAHGAAAPGTAPPRAAAAPARRILLVDDAATTRALTRSILEGSGYDVVAAADGDQAWALLQERGADLVLSDVEMPRMSGVELTRAIRASPRFARLPVVLLTALENDTDRRRGLEAGADAYLVKSTFDQRVLVETLAELLQEVP